MYFLCFIICLNRSIISDSCRVTWENVRAVLSSVRRLSDVVYRSHRSLRTVCGRLFKCFRSQIFIAQGREDSDMCGDPETCAESELNNLVLHNNAHPCAMTRICAILNNIKGACVGCVERTPPVRRLRYVRY